MAYDFAAVKVRLATIAEDVDGQRQRLGQAKAAITACKNTLAAMPTTYGQVVSDTDAGAAANPTNVAWTTAKAEKDLLVANFQALTTEVQAAVDALAAL